MATEPVTLLRAIGYTRVSTDDQPTRIADDTARIEAACRAWRYELIEVITDVGVSGKVPLADRPGGSRVHELIEARSARFADVLVVTNLDRLTRESEDGITLIRRMVPNGRRHPLLLVSLDDHIDLAGALGRFFAKFRVLLGEFERELIGERTSNSLQHRRRTGRVYSHAPYGWDGSGKGQPLVPNPAEQAVLADMKSWRAAGVNDNAIATRLNTAGVMGKRGGRWQANLVYRVLANVDRIGSET